MKKLLIICRQPFGRLVDIYKWCEHLGNDYQVEVISFANNQRVDFIKDNVTVHEVSNSGNRVIRGLRFFVVSLWHILFFRGSIIVEFFSGCEIFKTIFPWKEMTLDIRTLSVVKDDKERNEWDERIKKAVKLFDHITVISDGVKQFLGLEDSKAYTIPLGADVMSETDKDFQTIRLLYIGTFNNRDLDKTIKGFAIFVRKNPTLDIHYDIVGDGLNNELQEYKQLVLDLNLNEYVTFYGSRPHTELKQYLDRCNIGVAFVPVTSYYHHQPSTKIYEYALSGLYSIATSTYSNKRIINEHNGIIINDDAEAFAEALEYINKNKRAFNSNAIRSTLKDCLWKNIVCNYLEDFLSKH